MDAPVFRVIVVRAWREGGSLRIRLLTDGGSSRHYVVATIAEARDVIGALLGELETGVLASGVDDEVPTAGPSGSGLP